MAKQKSFSLSLTIFACIIAFVIGVVAGFFGWSIYKSPKGGDVYVSGDLQIHFMELDLKNHGDSIYIKAGNSDILIDAGARAESTETISKYINQFCTDGVLEYVIVTHADRDHIAGFAGSKEYESMFDRYECETIITFSKTLKVENEDELYTKYLNQLKEAVDLGATHYTAQECCNETNGAKKVYELSNGIEMEILYQKYYDEVSNDENDHSVCVMIKQGDNNFLLTGDLESKGETSLVENNNLPKVALFKAGHHGSKTSSNDVLLNVIKPDIVCVCCCAGYNEYRANEENIFPTQAMIDRVALYTDKVYITSLYDESETDGFKSMNGNIVVTSNRKGVTVNCSNNNNILKDTDWFKENRTMPSAWQ